MSRSRVDALLMIMYFAFRLLQVCLLCVVSNWLVAEQHVGEKPIWYNLIIMYNGIAMN